MIFLDEMYFEITFTGAKSEIKRMADFLKSGDLDDFFEIESDYVIYDDAYASALDTEKCSLTFTNDDYPIEIDEFDSDEFLELICRAAKNLYVEGRIFDSDDEEFEFISSEGDSYYINAKKIDRFNDELDERAEEEEKEEI